LEAAGPPEVSDDTGGWVAPAVEIPAVVAVVFMLKV
jgi:hypothetical protein